jgi:hypothetical protein
MVYCPPCDSMMTYAWDAWACGVVLYAMTTCRLPFEKEDLLAKRDLQLCLPEEMSDGMREKREGFFNLIIFIRFGASFRRFTVM